MLISLSKVPHIASGSREKPAPQIGISWEGRIGTGEGATIISSRQPPRRYTALGQSVPPRPSGSLMPMRDPMRWPPELFLSIHTELPIPSRGWGLWALLSPLHPHPSIPPLCSRPFLLQGLCCCFLLSNDVIYFLHTMR